VFPVSAYGEEFNVAIAAAVALGPK